ncbi:MAG TPA: hypothetical protein VLJ76_09845 [Gaiellaceae bacterium]|nr:hypothetical protein [Gaiellaceae bacterium]
MDDLETVIQEHLDLQRRNRLLEPEMPLDGYREVSVADVLEETQEWVLPESRTVLEHEPLFPPAEELWSGTPAFDWGE